MSSCMRMGAYRRLVAICAAALGVQWVGAGSAEAGLITPALESGQTYQLHDHPDGDAAEPFYGLRLDGLLNCCHDEDIFTFSFDYDDPSVGMFLEYDGAQDTIHIWGIAFGGLIDGHEYDADLSGLVEIDFLYENVTQAEYDNDLTVLAPARSDGSLRFTSGDLDGMEFALVDKANSEGYSFRLGDENNDEGHRGVDPPMLSGWGWLMHGDCDEYIPASDWLFTIDPTPVPGPSTALLATIGATLCLRRRRARTR